MKTLKYFTVLCYIFLLSSCSHYYLYVTSSTVNGSSEKYYYENDTLKITYELWANKGKMEFTIFNKLKTPIYIDWKNSALIINDNKYQYWQEKEISKGKTSHSTYESKNTSISVKDERVSSIPPLSKIKKVSLDKLRKSSVPKLDGFSMNFRNFLAFSLSEDVKDHFYIDNPFKVEKVEKLKKMPKPNNKYFYTVH